MTTHNRQATDEAFDLSSPENRSKLREEELLHEAIELIHSLMQEEGVTLEGLAQRTGVSLRTLSFVLDGEHNLTLRMLARIGDALGYSLTVQIKPQEEVDSLNKEEQYLRRLRRMWNWGIVRK